MAGDSNEDGKVFLRKDTNGKLIGYSEATISELLGLKISEFRSAKKKMIKFNKIIIDKNNVIQVVNWQKYQSEYKRQKHYRGDESYKRNRNSSCNQSDSLDIDRDKDIDIELNTYTEEFSQFWKLYDMKVAKQDALKAFIALRRRPVFLSDIMASIMGYHNHLKNEKIHNNFEKRKMYPATFLRNNKWKDFIGVEYEPPL
ncbi:unnamed protein product [marine sediment metagenome]|uniref:Phage replisome organiser N-terminal domain-containing protein n=1 Tax=marine sediment metagenome TaxID=412755 RepID=X0SXF9_9ZZZZ